MKTLTVVLSAVLVSLLTISRGEIVSEAENDVMPFSPIDSIIKVILEAMRPKLANLKVKDINQEIRTPGINATIKVANIVVQNADTFVIKSLKSTGVPLRLTNLTLTWDSVLASAVYDVDIVLNFPQVNVPVRIFGQGNARAALSGIYLTVGANMELKGVSVQIKPKGLFGFNVIVNNAEVNLSNLMGSPELGKSVGDLIAGLIPEVVDTLKMPIFDAFHDTIVAVINQVLKGHRNFALGEAPELPELSFEGLDSSEEFDFLPEESFDLGYEEPEFDESEA